MSMSTQINPADVDLLGGDMWDHIRREYLAGMKATLLCQRWGVSLSSFRLHARAGGWRRMDQPGCEAPPEPGEYHPDDQVGFADLADEAFLNIRRALGTGRASEAATWLRVYDKFADRARAEVMAQLPEVVTPRIGSRREPLTLTAAESDNLNDLSMMSERAEAGSQELDSLHPVFPESNS